MVEPDIEVIGDVADGQDAVDRVTEFRPDVILMDVRMPRLDGIEATKQIIKKHPGVRLLILTTYDLDAYDFDGLAVGASGFLLKDATPDQLVDAVRAVHSGDAVVTRRITRLMLETILWSTRQSDADAGAELAVLTSC